MARSIHMYYPLVRKSVPLRYVICSRDQNQEVCTKIDHRNADLSTYPQSLYTKILHYEKDKYIIVVVIGPVDMLIISRKCLRNFFDNDMYSPLERLYTCG